MANAIVDIHEWRYFARDHWLRNCNTAQHVYADSTTRVYRQYNTCVQRRVYSGTQHCVEVRICVYGYIIMLFYACSGIIVMFVCSGILVMFVCRGVIAMFVCSGIVAMFVCSGIRVMFVCSGILGTFL